MSRLTTPSQTVGPFYGFALPWPDDGPYAVAPDAPGALRVHGRVLDGDGVGVPDALIETWQADDAGRFPHPDDPRGAAAPRIRGFARCPTEPDGRFEIVTVKPGPLPFPAGGTEAPHLDVSVFARGLLHRLVTRVYFPDEEAANAADPVLSAITDPARRRTLIAVAGDDGLRFDIHLQGVHETVFFAC